VASKGLKQPAISLFSNYIKELLRSDLQPTAFNVPQYHISSLQHTIMSEGNNGPHYIAHYMKEEVQKMSVQKDINLEKIYRMISELQRDVALIRKCLIEELELRADFIEKMKDIDAEESIIVNDFGKRYGLGNV